MNRTQSPREGGLYLHRRPFSKGIDGVHAATLASVLAADVAAVPRLDELRAAGQRRSEEEDDEDRWQLEQRRSLSFAQYSLPTKLNKPVILPQLCLSAVLKSCLVCTGVVQPNPPLCAHFLV